MKVELEGLELVLTLSDGSQGDKSFVKKASLAESINLNEFDQQDLSQSVMLHRQLTGAMPPLCALTHSCLPALLSSLTFCLVFFFHCRGEALPSSSSSSSSSAAAAATTPEGLEVVTSFLERIISRVELTLRDVCFQITVPILTPDGGKRKIVLSALLPWLSFGDAEHFSSGPPLLSSPPVDFTLSS